MIDEDEDEDKVDTELKPRAPTPVKSNKSAPANQQSIQATSNCFVRNAQASRSVNYGHHRPTIGYLERVRASLQASTSSNTTTSASTSTSSSNSSAQVARSQPIQQVQQAACCQHRQLLPTLVHQQQPHLPILVNHDHQNQLPMNQLAHQQLHLQQQQQQHQQLSSKHASSHVPLAPPCQSASQFSALIDTMSPEQQKQHQNLMAQGIMQRHNNMANNQQYQQQQQQQQNPLSAAKQVFQPGNQLNQLTEQQLAQLHQQHYLHHLQQMHHLHQLHHHQMHLRLQQQQHQSQNINQNVNSSSSASPSSTGSESMYANRCQMKPTQSSTATITPTKVNNNVYSNLNGNACPTTSSAQQRVVNISAAKTNNTSTHHSSSPASMRSSGLQQQQAYSKQQVTNSHGHYTNVVGLPQIAEVNGLPTVQCLKATTTTTPLVKMSPLSSSNSNRSIARDDVVKSSRISSAGSPSSSSSASSTSSQSSSSPLSHLSPSSSSSSTSSSSSSMSSMLSSTNGQQQPLDRSNFIRHSTSMMMSHGATRPNSMLLEGRRHFSVERDITQINGNQQPLNAKLTRNSPTTTTITNGLNERNNNSLQRPIKLDEMAIVGSNKGDSLAQRLSNIKLNEGGLAFSSLRVPKSSSQSAIRALISSAAKQQSIDQPGEDQKRHNKLHQQQQQVPKRAHSSTPDRRRQPSQTRIDATRSQSKSQNGTNNTTSTNNSNNQNNNNNRSSLWFEYGCV